MKRIYDNPDHKHYGPIRRMFIMLANLDLLDRPDWDDTYAVYLNCYGNKYGEAWCARCFLKTILA